MMVIAIIFIAVLFSFVIALMLILIEVIEKKDKKIEQLNRLNNDISKECLELKKLLETQDKLLEAVM